MSMPETVLQRAWNALRRRARPVRRMIRRLARRRLHVHIENRWRLGDEIMAIPFYQLVRERYPNARITVAVNHPDLLRGNPYVEVRNDLTEFDGDRYICARDDARNVPRLRHLCQRAHVPYRDLSPSVIPAGPVADRRMGLRIACSCGAGWPCKSWPAGYLRKLCDLISAARPDAEFVELGKGCACAGVGETLVDRLGVGDTAGVLAQCRFYIGPDSGLSHLAPAVGTPALTLYGPVHPDTAFGRRDHVWPVVSPAPCAGCWTDGRMRIPGRCPLGIVSDNPDEYPCMRHLVPDLVFEALRGTRLLEAPP